MTNADKKDVYYKVFNEETDSGKITCNKTIVVHGPTGSGKTYTVFGPDGLIALFLSDLFNNRDGNVEMKITEIYLNIVTDQVVVLTTTNL